VASSIRHDTVTKRREDERASLIFPQSLTDLSDGWQSAFY
jgi:hypothetical protein